MKKLLFSILALAIISSVCGCDFSWQRYVDKEYRFSILLPRFWEKEKGVENTVIIAKAPLKSSADKFQPNVNVVVNNLPQQLGLPTFFEGNKEALMASLSSISMVTEGDIHAGFLAGKWLSFEGKMQDLTLKIISAAWLKNGRIYVVTCTSQAGEFKEYSATFNKIIRSLRIR